MPGNPYTRLRIDAGTDYPVQAKVPAGDTIPVVITAAVEGDRAVAGGIRLRVERPDGIVVQFEERDLTVLSVNSWRALLCLDVVGQYALEASCRTPVAAVVQATRLATPSSRAAPPGSPDRVLLAQSGLPWITRDGRPWLQNG